MKRELQIEEGVRVECSYIEAVDKFIFSFFSVSRASNKPFREKMLIRDKITQNLYTIYDMPSRRNTRYRWGIIGAKISREKLT